MELNTVVPIGLKPTVRSLNYAEYREFDIPHTGDCLLSIYYCAAEVQRMMRIQDGAVVWQGTWAWLSEQEAMNCARAESFKDGITEGRNLFFRIEDSFDNLRRAIYADTDAEESSFAIDPIIERHVEDGDDCLIATFDPYKDELRQFHVRGHYLRWWHIERPIIRENARAVITKVLEDYEISPGDLEYIEVLRPKKAG